MLHIVAQRYPFPQRRGDQLAVGKMVDFCQKNNIPYKLWVSPTRENRDAAKTYDRKQNLKFLHFSTLRFLLFCIRYPFLPFQIKLFSGFYIPVSQIAKGDKLYIHTIRMSASAPNVKNRIFMGAQIDLAAEFRERASSSNIIKGLFLSIEAWLLSRWCFKNLSKYEVIFLVTDDEFKKNRLPNMITNPHGFDGKRIQKRVSSKLGRKRIGFFGNMKFGPNLLAAEEYLQWQTKSNLDCEFVVFGKGSRHLNMGDVICLGEVNNIDKEIASLDVLVNLVSVGGGFQNKTIEAWAQNVPVIGYEQAFRGLSDCSELKIVVDNVNQLDAVITKLLKSKNKIIYSAWVEKNWHQEKNLKERFEIMGVIE